MNPPIASTECSRPRTPSMAVLISGSGTTLVNLAREIAAGSLPVSIVGVISSRSGVAGIARANELGLPVEIIERKSFADSASFSHCLTARLDQWNPDFVCMAGFLSLWNIPPHYTGRVLNIHPALLPKFGGRGMHGLKVHQAVIAAGDALSGCTVHLADNQYDHGPVLLQRTCPVLPADTPDALAARVFVQECKAYPEAIRLFLISLGLKPSAPENDRSDMRHAGHDSE